MTNFKLISAAAILSAAIATPALHKKLSRNLACRRLPEPGCRIPVERDGKRHGFDTQRLKCERAGEAHFREALHQRPQDVTRPRQVGARPQHKAVHRTAFAIRPDVAL